MEVTMKKREVFMGFMLFLIIMVGFPLLPQAIELEVQNEIEEVEEVEDLIEEDIEEEAELEYPEEWEIVIIDEPLPVAVPIFLQVESNDTAEEKPINKVLPKTGGIYSLSHKTIGIIMILLGLNINKQRQT